MNDNLFDIEQDFWNCDKCNLAENRTKQETSIEFGSGYADAVGVLITHKPLTAKGVHTKSKENLDKIWDKVKIDERDWYDTSVIMCPNAEHATFDQIKSCNERLKATIYTISPKVIVLMGAPSYFSFFGEFNTTNPPRFGPIACENYKVFFTYDLEEYFSYQENDKTKASHVAQEILSHWTMISNKIKEIVSL